MKLTKQERENLKERIWKGLNGNFKEYLDGVNAWNLLTADWLDRNFVVFRRCERGEKKLCNECYFEVYGKE